MDNGNLIVIQGRKQNTHTLHSAQVGVPSRELGTVYEDGFGASELTFSTINEIIQAIIECDGKEQEQAYGDLRRYSRELEALALKYEMRKKK